MNPSHTNPFLRRVLKLQAITEVAVGLITLAEANWLATILALPQGLVPMIGAVALVFGAFIYYIATRRHVPASGVWAIIVINAIWAVDCIVALAGGWLEPNALGSAVIIGEAILAAVLAEVELIALRRTRATVAAAA